MEIAQCVQSLVTDRKEQAFVVQIPQYAKIVSGLEKNVSAVDIDVGKRVAVTQERFAIAVGMRCSFDCRKHWTIRLMLLYQPWKWKRSLM